LKRAFVKAHERVLSEFFALGTEFAARFVVVSAVDFNHVADGFLFTFHSFVFWVRRLRLHGKSVKKMSGVITIKALPKRGVSQVYGNLW